MRILDNDLLSTLPTDKDGNWISTPVLIERLQGAGFDVQYSKKIIRRLKSLEEDGLVTSRQAGRTLEWQRKHGTAGFTKGFMPLEEALALQLLRRFSTRRLPQQAEASLQGLFNAAEERLKRAVSSAEKRYAAWHQKVDVIGGAFQLQSPPIGDEVFRTVMDALFKEQLLMLKYQRPKQRQPSERFYVMPLGLVESMDGLLYLIGRPYYRDSLNDEPRQYRMDRIKQAQLSSREFDYPAGFLLDDYIRKDKEMDFFVEGKAQVVLRTSEDLGRRLQETPLHPKQTVTQHRNGSMTIQAEIHLGLRFTEWLLAQGRKVEVLRPKSLREKLKAEIEQMHNLYC